MKVEREIIIKCTEETDKEYRSIDGSPTEYIVRCKDCKSSRVYGKTTKWLACEDVMEGQATDPNGYCYLGERREP